MSDNGENKGNEVYKITTIIDHVRQNSTEFEPLNYQFISKQIVQGKTCFTGIYKKNAWKSQQNRASKILFILAHLVLWLISSSTLEQHLTDSSMVLVLWSITKKCEFFLTTATLRKSTKRSDLPLETAMTKVAGSTHQ